MLIEFGIFAAVCCIIGAVVTLYQRRQDVLHGPYIDKRSSHQKRRV
ncbi:MAG: hypothetical protein WA702_05560 [Bradyrhizobium sp.]